MKNLAVIKSERSLKMVTNLLEKKLRGSVSIFGGDYNVRIQEWVKGEINVVKIESKYHMLTKCVIDHVWEVIDEYEKKYDSNCICGTIQSSPYLASDNETWLSMPVIEVSVRVFNK